ncbi:glycoside hydrolase family 3 protein, partial [Liquorilactobacillus vini]|uniref:glycoside hydrolase family 3 protein n=1 Tax=Liquorilactobacillus vini TaxID=238015 RepID=UPI0002FB9445
MEAYKDSSKSINVRVNDLLKRMTLEEKLAQLCGNLPFNIIRGNKVNIQKLKEIAKDGLGRITQFSLVGLINKTDIVHLSNEIQKFFIEETRLGIPVVFQSESLVGYPGKGGTIFPSMMNLAATWNETLANKMALIIGQEVKSVGISSVMSPVLDVSRDPRWGRTYETFGEDPYLITQMGINYIRGIQSNNVSAIAKHFLGYAETQGGLNLAAERLNSRELYEVFATPFEAAINEADVDGIMGSYSEINGLPVGANPKIGRKLLRDILGFKGMFTSDGAAIWKMYNYYKIAASYDEAGLIALKAGIDTEIPVGSAFKNLKKYVKNGRLSEKLVDESVKRVLWLKFKRGLFEHPYVSESNKVYLTDFEKQNLNKKISDESIVLFKE